MERRRVGNGGVSVGIHPVPQRTLQVAVGFYNLRSISVSEARSSTGKPFSIHTTEEVRRPSTQSRCLERR